MIAEDWVKLKNVQERNVMIRRAQSARIIVMCAYYIMAISYLFIIILPAFGMSIRLTSNITDPGRLVPLQTYYIYNVTKRPQYELTYISQAIYILFAVMSYTGIDHFLGLLIFNICGQLKNLTKRLCQNALRKIKKILHRGSENQHRESHMIYTYHVLY